MLLPFGIVTLNGLSATCKFVTGAPSTRKWPVAPESEMEYSTARLSFSTLAVFCALLEKTPCRHNYRHYLLTQKIDFY